MLNYAVDPGLLRAHVPVRTELDFFQGQTFLSLVGFRFLRTRVLGVPIPFHRNFDEVNLRFYVRRQEGAEIRRGVVFIREIVPRRAIAFVARAFYNENYIRLPMTHRIDEGVSAEYRWCFKDNWNRLLVRSTGEGALCRPGSCEQFITEHYWGYAKQRDGSTVEYEVEHPPWRVWRAAASSEGDVAALYGTEFGRLLSQPPHSALLAEGSPVTVYRGTKLR